MKYRIILGILTPMLFLSFAIKKNSTELTLKPRINEKLQYVVKRTTVGNSQYQKFGFKWYSEYKIQFILNSIDEQKKLNYDFRQIYYVKRDSSYNKGIEKFDTRETFPDEIMHFKSMRNEIKKHYKISLKNNGEISKNWTLKNGDKPNSGVFDIYNFQIIFPEKDIVIGEEWEYESKGPFTKYHKSKSTFFIKEIDSKQICIGFKSFLITDDLMNNTEAYGEYILEKSTCNLIYAKIESEINGNAETLEIEKF